MTSRRTILLATLVALLQIGFLGWTILGRAAVLRDGRELVLKVEPVDPRDFLRGDYVRLGYEIGRLPPALFVDPSALGRNHSGAPVWVRMERHADGYWRPVAASIDAPLAAPPAPGQVDLKGRRAETWGASDVIVQAVMVHYGIERYYVPEGEGRAIEEGIGVRPFGIVAAVGSDGTPQIKALMDGDKRLYEEPWY